MAQEGNETQAKFNIPDSISTLAESLKGIPGASDIMDQVAQEAIQNGIITENKPVLENNNSQSAESVINDPIIDPAQTPEVKPDGQAPLEELIEEEVVDPILGSVKTKVKKADIIDNFDALKELSKKELGVEISDFKTLQKFIDNSAKKWRQDSQKVAEVQDQLKQYESMFDSMPAEMLDGVKAFFEGRSDWKQAIVSNSSIDYRKSLDEIKTKDLVEHYFPGEFAEEDFSAEEKPKALVLAEKAAKDKFSIEKKSREEKSAKEIKAAQDRFDARKLSISSSFKSLKESFPNLDNGLEKQIKTIMESGDINSVFFNKDGSFKPEAAESLMMAIRGKETINKLVEIAKNQAESKANEEILTRSADKKKEAKGTSTEQGAGSERVKKEINDLLGGINKKKTY